MISLPTTIESLGAQMSGITATLVERTQFAALYKRNDGYWECFTVVPKKNVEWVDGKAQSTEEMREYYPALEEFGKTAWCNRERLARIKYESIKNHQPKTT